MIEQAPAITEPDNLISKMVQLEMSGALKKIQDEYLYWDKVKYRAKDTQPQELWSAVKKYRWLRAKRLQFGKVHFSYVITDYLERALHQFDMHIGGNLTSNTGIAEADKNKFIISSLIEESISSSQMEGASTTRKKAKEMIQQAKKPKNRSEQMILNNYFTMKYISEHKNDEFSVDNILKTHYLITKDTLDDAEDEGRFREHDEIFVVDHSNGEVVQTPPPAEEISMLIKDLETFFNTDTENFIHPIVKGCIIHFMIGWIHPFCDGNGRTARAAFYWYMLKKGYWLTEYLSISRIIQSTKAQYEKAYLYTETDQNDLTYFITYHIRTMEKAFEELKQYINRKQRDVKQAAEFIRIPGVNDRMAQILKLISDEPERILSAKEMEARFSVSNYTERMDLKALVNMDLLEVIQVNKQKQNFIRSANFEKVLKKYLK